MKKPVSVLFSYSLVALAAAYTRPFCLYIYWWCCSLSKTARVFSPPRLLGGIRRQHRLLIAVAEPIGNEAGCHHLCRWRKFFFHPITPSSFSWAKPLSHSYSLHSSQRRLSAYIDTEHLGRRLRIYRSHNMRDLGGGRRERERVREGDTVKQTRRKVYFGMEVH
jgi:hypothetical protein